MASKPNQRVEQTRASVRRALILALRRQPLHRISIRELCQMAGINRTTFYNHYGSQYEVLSDIRDRYLADVEAAIESADPGDREDLLSRVTLVFAYMEQNLEVSRLLIHNNIDETFAQRLLSLPKITDLLTVSLQGSPDGEQYRDMVSFAISGSYKLLQDWIARDSRRSPGEMAALVLGLANAVFRLGQ